MYSEEDEDEWREGIHRLKGWRVFLSWPFALLTLVMMGVVWCMLRAVMFMVLTTVQIQDFAGPENKKFHRFRLWVDGGCYDCQQERESMEEMDAEDDTAD